MFLLNSQSCTCGYLESTDYLFLLNSQSCSCGYLEGTDYLFLLNSQSCSCGYLEGTDYLFLLNSQSCSCGYLEGSPFFLSWSYFVTASLYLCRSVMYMIRFWTRWAAAPETSSFFTPIYLRIFGMPSSSAIASDYKHNKQ